MAHEERQFLADGWTATIFRLSNTQKVVKVLDKKLYYPCEEQFRRELAANERIAQHNPPASVLKFYGVDEPLGLILELAQKGSMDNFLRECRGSKSAPSSDVLLRWARQAAEALAFVHSCGILHCDIYVPNFFLDNELNLKLADFGAAAIDGGSPLMMYRETHQLWVNDGGKWRKDISIASEIFALGSAMFNMETCRDSMQGLRSDKDRDEIERRLKAKELPPVDDAPVLGRYIEKCWNSKYDSMTDLLCDLNASEAIGGAGIHPVTYPVDGAKDEVGI
ncbi:hypothetical protein PMZ80_002571 [Knufia obscura]|uniref:Protein kinase domain-containing protein n=1 Tax=Knufia obscura TaxID=1635080 RepID=A0ABR0RXN5_9EURO|nr:hypothetical protein PMZ80_002571 [Knufia obscura]